MACETFVLLHVIPSRVMLALGKRYIAIENILIWVQHLSKFIFWDAWTYMSLHEHNSILWVCLIDKKPQILLSLFYYNEGPANAFRETNSPKLVQDEVCHRQPLPLLIQALFFLKQWLFLLTTHLFRVELGQRKVSRSVSQVQSNICEKNYLISTYFIAIKSIVCENWNTNAFLTFGNAHRIFSLIL